MSHLDLNRDSDDFDFIDIDKTKQKDQNRVGRFLEGSPLKFNEYDAIINEPGLNQIDHFQMYARLSVIDDFFRKFKKEKPEKLRVFYGFRKLTPKIMRKPSILIIYENAFSYRNDSAIKRRIEIVHQRFQTDKESEDAETKNRMFSSYEYFINEKPWNANIEGILFDNFVAEENNVSLEEREVIRYKLREKISKFYGSKIKNTYQSSFKF